MTAKKPKTGGPWKKGQSGNPKGRPPKTRERREIEEHCRQAMANWASVEGLRLAFAIAEGTLEDVEVPIKQRVEMVKWIIEMGIGRAPQSMQLNTEPQGGAITIKMVRDERPS